MSSKPAIPGSPGVLSPYGADLEPRTNPPVTHHALKASVPFPGSSSSNIPNLKSSVLLRAVSRVFEHFSEGPSMEECFEVAHSMSKTGLSSCMWKADFLGLISASCF